MAQAATHPTAAVLGSPANSLGSALSQFLSHRTKYPSRKSKTPPKPQCKHHASFRLLRRLPGHGLGRTRSRLARTASANRFVRSSLRYLQPLSQRWLKAVFPRTIHYYQQVPGKEEKQKRSLRIAKTKKSKAKISRRPGLSSSSPAGFYKNLHPSFLRVVFL